MNHVPLIEDAAMDEGDRPGGLGTARNLSVLEPVFRTGVTIIDNQHRRLIDLLHDLQHAVDSRCSKEIICEFLTDFSDMAIHHFEDEEALMARVGYPGLAEHRQEHEWLTIELLRFAEEFDEGKSVAVSEVVDFLWQWTIVHLVDSDSAYVPYLTHLDVSHTGE